MSVNKNNIKIEDITDEPETKSDSKEQSAEEILKKMEQEWQDKEVEIENAKSVLVEKERSAYATYKKLVKVQLSYLMAVIESQKKEIEQLKAR